MPLESQVAGNTQPDIRVTRVDFERLEGLLRSHEMTWRWSAVEFLARELSRAKIIEDNPDSQDFVKIHSQVLFHEEGCELDPVVTLTCPGSNRLYGDALSVLTPIGAALVGLSEGQSITYPGPDGRGRRFTVLKILSGRQGDYTSRHLSCG